MPLYCVHAGSPDKVYVFPEDTADGGTPSGSDLSEYNLPSDLRAPVGATVSDRNLIVIDNNGDEAFWFALPLSGSPLSPSKTIDLTSGNTEPSAATVVGMDLVVSDFSDRRLYFSPLDSADGAEASVSKWIFIPTAVGFPAGITSEGNDIYIADSLNDSVHIISATTAHQGIPTVRRTINLPSEIGSASGITKNGNALYICDSSDDKIYVIDADTAHNTTAVIRREFNLPSGLTNPQGLAFEGGAITAEITTQATGIRGNALVDFSIEFSGSVTGFADSDVSVSGGTITDLTGSGTSYVLSVRAATGSGTIVISIGTDVVDEGNASASASFTRTARPTAAVTFDPATVRNGRTTQAEIVWSESVTGFAV